MPGESPLREKLIEEIKRQTVGADEFASAFLDDQSARRKK